MSRKYYFSSESVTDGHPDKVCDQIADAILDEALKLNPHAKMAVEATIKDGVVLVYGEQNLGPDLKDVKLNYSRIAKDVLADIGLDEDQYNVITLVGDQSADIFNKVVLGNEVAAGDQGIMFGYASNETENYMPLAIDTAHKLSKRLSDLKRENKHIRPDGKTQVTVLYEDDKPVAITKVVVSTQHSEAINLQDLKDLILNEVILKVIDPKCLTPETE